MAVLISLLFALRDGLRSRATLQLEVLALCLRFTIAEQLASKIGVEAE
jgi:hypothetical protein